jgi:LytS/YehU family sensor histidine kinase
MKDYLSIEQIRFGNRLKFSFKTKKECAGAKVPTMILQPLFENAIKHGVYESVEPVGVRFSCASEREYLKITIQNDYDPEVPGRKGTGLGLQNVKQRIELSYNGKGFMKWSAENGVFTVMLFIPRLINMKNEKN